MMFIIKIVIHTCKVLIILGLVNYCTGDLFPQLFNQLGQLVGQMMFKGGA